MKYDKINSSLFVNNRRKLQSKLKENSIAVFNSNDVMPTNADGTMPFKQNSDLFWLSGVDQEESVLVIAPNHTDKNMREILFLKETNKNIAIWEGAKLSKDEAFEVLEFCEKNGVIDMGFFPEGENTKWASNMYHIAGTYDELPMAVS